MDLAAPPEDRSGRPVRTTGPFRACRPRPGTAPFLPSSDLAVHACRSPPCANSKGLHHASHLWLHEHLSADPVLTRDVHRGAPAPSRHRRSGEPIQRDPRAREPRRSTSEPFTTVHDIFPGATKAACALNDCDVAVVQHEYGIYAATTERTC